MLEALECVGDGQTRLVISAVRVDERPLGCSNETEYTTEFYIFNATSAPQSLNSFSIDGDFPCVQTSETILCVFTSTPEQNLSFAFNVTLFLDAGDPYTLSTDTSEDVPPIEFCIGNDEIAAFVAPACLTSEPTPEPSHEPSSEPSAERMCLSFLSIAYSPF